MDIFNVSSVKKQMLNSAKEVFPKDTSFNSLEEFCKKLETLRGAEGRVYKGKNYDNGAPSIIIFDTYGCEVSGNDLSIMETFAYYDLDYDFKKELAKATRDKEFLIDLMVKTNMQSEERDRLMHGIITDTEFLKRNKTSSEQTDKYQDKINKIKEQQAKNLENRREIIALCNARIQYMTCLKRKLDESSEPQN